MFEKLVASPYWVAIKVGIIVLTTFLAARIAGFLLSRWSRRYSDSLKGKEKSSAVTTRREVFRRVGVALVWFIGITVLVFQFPAVRSLGFGLFASAGALGLVLGLAAQSTLSNIISGLVLSFSQPLRLGDAVIMDDDFGYVEEITLMQTFIRTWDNRRIIVPNDVLSNRIIQNWSIRDPKLLASTIIYLDYGADVDKVREWIIKTVKESEYWNEEGEPGVQVMDFTEKTVKLRAVAWADDPPSAWNLRCEIRESLLAHFEEEGLEFPRFRVEAESWNKQDFEGRA